MKDSRKTKIKANKNSYQLISIEYEQGQQISKLK